MGAKSINRGSLVAVFLFSLATLSILVVTFEQALIAGHMRKPEPDEGTAAHIFQLSIILLMPATLVFLATAQWERPWHVARALIIPVVAVGLAFGLLYYFEHSLPA